MAQSLENKFESAGSILGYPNNPAQPIATQSGPSAAAKTSTIHDLYSYDGNPPANVAAPRFENTGTSQPLPEPTRLQQFTGPRNDLAAGAGFNQYNSETTYDSFILAQGATE